MHSQFDPLPLPEYQQDKNKEKQLQSHIQKLKKQYNSKEHKKLINKAKDTWERELEELMDKPNEVEESVVEIEALTIPITNETEQEKKLSRQEKRALKKKQQEEQMLKSIENEPKIDYKQIELDKLSLELKKHKLELQNMLDIPGNGDCMFSAIAYELNKLKISMQVQELRNTVVAFIKKNKAEFEPFFSDVLPFDDYLEGMLGHHWGGHLELMAITKLFRININVYSVDGLVQISTEYPKTMNLIYLKHYLALGQHYNCFK